MNRWLLADLSGRTSVTVTTTLALGDKPRILARRLVGKKLGAASEQMLSGLADEVRRRAKS
ncbi:MAG: hypothetical protein R2706_05745 [Acidimicrobiales bacterium]